ncbi:MAG: PhaM family polyhydroxyalkanoate granule multifunctional regulatory protein [Limnohabitans sp.]
MADNAGFNFDPFLPGFDFLKQFAQANPAAAMPSAAQWVTPTLDPAELDKRIQDLKSVQFWLDQNAKALSATIQALEVQRMTLSTLQSMNVGMADLAAAMSGKTSQQSSAQDQAKPSTASSAVDPMQWWGAIGQQFQTIASQAVADMQKHASTFAATSDKATQPIAKKASAAGARQTAARPAGKTRSKPRKNTP